MPDNLTQGYGFSIGNTGYIQSGVNSVNGVNNLYGFTTSGPSDPGTWTLIGPLGVKNALSSGFVLGNTAYFGGGALWDSTQAVRFNSLTPPSTTLTPMPVLPDTVNKSAYKPGSGNIYSYTSGASDSSVYCTAPADNNYLGFDAGGAIISI
jgi:hypothetical protein